MRIELTDDEILIHIPRKPLEALRAQIELPGLTLRQRQVLELVVAGKSNKEIAQAIAISVRTVKFHVSRMLALFQVSDRQNLTLQALRLGTSKKTSG